MAGAASTVAAIIAAFDGVWQFSVWLAVPTVVLFIGLIKAWPRVQLLAQVALIIELIILGGIWPSIITIVALLALPSVVLGIIYLIKRRSPRWGEIYLLVSTLLASVFLLCEAIILATAQH
jgi:hypothetical protein